LWPAHSPLPMSCEYYGWGCFKGSVYRNKKKYTHTHTHTHTHKRQNYINHLVRMVGTI
jgi:hypothetical protein